MNKPGGQMELRILLLEDVPTDAELAEHALREAGLSFTLKRVDTRDAFVRALGEFNPDIVLADYNLPSFDGGSALKIVRQQYPDVPVIMVTGAVGDEKAVELLRQGARDYILKDRLARLGPAVRRVLSEDRDTRARKAAEEALKESAERNRAIMETANDAIICMKPDGTIHLWNHKAEEMFGYSAGEAIGRNLHQLVAPGRYHENIEDGLRQFSTSGAGPMVGRTLELTAWRKDRVEFPIELSISPLNIRGEWHATGIIRDITARKKSEEMIWKQANFDTLTGLPNRHMFHDRLEQEIKKANRDGMGVALLSVGLDKFKEVNDTLGHSMGDLLLIEMSRRIGGCVRGVDTVARLGGDEFAVIVSAPDDIGSLDRLAGNLLQRIAEPVQLGSEKAYMSASIGITLYPNDATGTEDMLKNADQAMHTAKDKGHNRFSYFTQTMQEMAQTRLRLANSLRGAVADSQLMVYFQPIVELATGNINKAEALVRWQHPEHGLINPSEFIPLAEETGLIVEIGDWVFRESMRWAKRWRELYNPLLQVSVNKSPVQFHKDGDDPTAWLSHLRELGLPGQSLAVEITEGLLMDANASVTGALFALRDAGINVSMDDFGTGYSSLSYLKKFHIDYLKIDQSFVRDMVTDPNDMALSEAIIVMAHKLGIKVIAEGVETKKQLNLLALAGCDYAQGYLYSRPVPPEEFEELLKQGYL